VTVGCNEHASLLTSKELAMSSTHNAMYLELLVSLVYDTSVNGQ